MTDQPTEDVQPQPVPEPAFESAPQPAEGLLENFDDEDVKSALETETQDGPGDLDKLPAEDFQSFAEPDVEQDEA